MKGDAKAILLSEAVWEYLQVKSYDEGFFGRLGVKIFIARTGGQALAVIARAPLKLVVLDADMPKIKGYEICRKVKSHERFASLPFILVAPAEEEETVRLCREAGCDEVIPRRFSIELLTRSAAKWMKASIRRDVRLPVEMRIDYSMSDSLYEATLIDLSAEGALLAMESCALERGYPMELRFRLPTFSGPMSVKATIMRIHRRGDGGGYDVGVRFVEISREDKRRLEVFIEENRSIEYVPE